MSIKGVDIAVDDNIVNENLVILRKMLDFNSNIEFDYIETPSSGLGVIENGMVIKEQCEVVRNVLRHYPFKYTVRAGPDDLTLFSINNEEYFKILKASIEFSSFIDSKIGVYHGDFASKDKNNFSHFAKEFDLTITIENLDKNSSRSYLTYTDAPVKIMKVVS